PLYPLSLHDALPICSSVTSSTTFSRVSRTTRYQAPRRSAQLTSTRRRAQARGWCSTDRAMTEVAPDLGSHANPGRRPWRIEGRPPEREPGLVAPRRRATDATGAARERCRALAAYP